MRRRILVSVLLLLAIFAIAAATAALFIRKTSGELDHLVSLHEIDGLRHRLASTESSIRSGLISDPAADAGRLEEFVARVRELQTAAADCRGCHHEPDVNRSLDEVAALVDDYVVGISDLMVSSAANGARGALEAEVSARGERLFRVTETMAEGAGRQLEARSLQTLHSEARVRWLILGSLSFALLLGGVVAVHLINSVTRPVDSLLEATRRIRSGDMEVELEAPGTEEFGELAATFNDMTSSLKETYAKLELEIEDHRHTTEALRESEGFLRTVFESVEDPFLVFDSDCRVVRINEAYARLTDAAVGELLGRPCFEIFGKSSREECVIACSLGATEPSVHVVQFPAAGGEAWHEVYTHPILDADGKVTHVIVYSRDVTDRKAAETAVAEMNERFELAAAGANDGLWDWRIPSGRFVMSPRWLSIVGCDESLEERVESWLSRVHPSDIGRVRRALNAHLDRGEDQFGEEHRIRHSDGTWIWVLARGLAVRDEEGVAYRMAGSLTDISQRKAYEEELIHNAVHDPLTDLPNRPLIRDRLRQAEARKARNPDYQFAVLFLDLDRFKVVNDILGHQAGDQLLVAVAKELRSCVRSNDSVGRLGGDEFVVLLDGIEDIAEAELCARRIQEGLDKPIRVGGHDLHVSASIGIATSDIEHEKAGDLLRFADIAMYQGKAQRSGEVRVYRPGRGRDAVSSLDLENELHGVIERGELRVHYQPIVALNGHRAVGLEALVRWEHPSRGLIEPGLFLPMAEQSGKVVEIGAWVIEEAIRQGLKFAESHPEAQPLFMSVNVSMRQLLDRDFVEMVGGFLESTGYAPEGLRIELTENVLAYDAETMAEVLTSLKDLGLGICLADFGSGYSSLSHLASLPISCLKLGPSFVRQLNAGGRTPEIIRAIVNLAKSLSLQVIADGVEESHQFEAVEELGCDLVQGFHVARPAEPSSIEEWLADRS